MDHRQLDAFLTGIYRRGIDEGREEGALNGRIQTIRTREQAWKAFTGAINAVKGIGERRRQELRLAFRERFGEEKGTNDAQ